MFKITQTAWYQETQRISGFSPKVFAMNAVISVTLMAALGVFCLVVNL